MVIGLYASTVLEECVFEPTHFTMKTRRGRRQRRPPTFRQFHPAQQERCVRCNTRRRAAISASPGAGAEQRTNRRLIAPSGQRETEDRPSAHGGLDPDPSPVL